MRQRNKIRNVADLPDWFKLDKYAGVVNLDAIGWYEQIKIRHSILQKAKRIVQIMNRSPSSDQEWIKSEQDELQKALDLIRENPIVNTDKEAFWRERRFIGEVLQELKKGSPQYGGFGIYLTTLGECFPLKEELIEEIRGYIKYHEDERIPIDDLELFVQSLETSVPASANQPISELKGDSTVRLNVTVNMGLPDNILIEQFKVFLKRQRHDSLQKEGNEIERKHKPDFQSWTRCGILPYIDLRWWGLREDKSILNRVMADAIFPPGEGGEEVIRKTTAPIVKEILTGRYLEKLAAIAACEVAERNRP